MLGDPAIPKITIVAVTIYVIGNRRIKIKIPPGVNMNAKVSAPNRPSRGFTCENDDRNT
jgi:hypothetical protein